MSTRPLVRPLALAGAVGLLAAGCGTSSDNPGESSTGAAGEVSVVATTSILGSIAGDVMACAGGEVTTLMQPGDDPHSFQPSSAEIVDLTRADAVFSNGLGLESGLDSALANAGVDGANIVEVAPEVDPIPWNEADTAHGHEGETAEEHAGHDHGAADESTAEPGGDAHAHDHGATDPHFWMDVARGAEAAAFIGETLAATTGDETFATCGTEVHDELLAVDQEITEILAAVPAENRTLVTDHDSFGYFAHAYDFDVAGVVVPGGSTDAEPSSAQMAHLVATIDEAGVDAIFSNTAASTSLVDAVAAETGTEVDVVELYVGSVGPADSEAATYADMMRVNAQRIADSLS